MRMLRRIKDVTLIGKVKSVYISKELGVNSIKENVREMRLPWYGHMQKMEENNEMRAIVDMIVPGKRPRGRPRGIWVDCVRRDMRSRNCGSPRGMPKTEHSGNQEFGLLIPTSGKRRRRRLPTVKEHNTMYHCTCVCLLVIKAMVFFKMFDQIRNVCYRTLGTM